MLLYKIPLSFNYIFVLLLYHWYWYQVQSKKYRIEFDTKFSPPSVIPKDPRDLVYSVPLNQAISKPIIARVLDVANEIVTPNGDPDVTVSSLDASQLKGMSTDNWKASGGKLCQRTFLGQAWPLRFDRSKYKKLCGSGKDLTVLRRKFVKNMIILDWLSHEHPGGSIPSTGRFLRVSIPDMRLTADTEIFNITVPAAALIISKQPPKTITANTDFDISAEIHDIRQNIITEGLDSVLYVELTVPYDYKQFYNSLEKEMLIYNTDVRLGGDNVAIHHSTYDLVIRKQASRGRVHFKNIRILDVVSKFKLNLTMYMSRDPWLRSPDCLICYADIYEKDIDTYGLVRFRPMSTTLLNKIPAVSLTRSFDVVEQKLDKLYISSPFKRKGRVQITRNFPIPGPLYIEAKDKYGNRIHSGSYANLPMEIETYPKGICISEDHTKYIHDGFGKLVGSICQIARSVHLIIYSKIDPSIIANSTEFEVVGDVHIAHFDHFRYSSGGLHMEPHVNSFVRFGATDINTGAIRGVLKHFQMKIILDTIETHDDVGQTIHAYAQFRERAERQPHRKLRAVIMPKNRKTSAAMIRDVNNDEITMFSLSQKSMEFREDFFFNRLCWNWDQITRFFLAACKDRGWYHMSILKMSDEVIPHEFLKLSSSLNITFNEAVNIQLFDPSKWKTGMLHDKIHQLRTLKTRIIVCFVNSTYQPIVLSEAYQFKISSHEGYQWLFLSDYAWAFPINSLCGINVKCSEAFKGSLLFTETYNNSHFYTKDWHRALDYFLSVDRVEFLGLEAIYPDSDMGSFMGLGYDAVWLFAQALNRIISWQMTATGVRLTDEIRRVAIEGLTGVLKLDSIGEREGFIGTIKVVNPEPESRIQLIRYVKQVEPGFRVELKYGTTLKHFDPDSQLFLTVIPLPESEVYNVREFSSYSGGINKENNKLIEDKTEAWPSTRMRRFEKIVPHFTCKQSCGKRVSITDINLYDRGTCIAMDKCDCHLGYYGHSCEEISCTCLFGDCFEPFRCTCTKGWEGAKCDKPICSSECKHGKCYEPEMCKCSSKAWIGPSCSHHIAAIITPLVLIVALLVYFGYKGSFWLKKYLERRAALSDLSWVVEWTELTLVDTTTTSKTSCMFEELYSWNRERWFVKKFNSKTIDVDDSRVRVDMTTLMTLHHKNLITFGGACLTYPNVCLLVEPAHKGSLEDILVNDDIELGWDFRFSFLKDICTGMNYLHTNTDIISHGRLKSSNCLLDKRWTIRLSGFGAPTIRYGPYSLLQTDQVDPQVYHENQTSLLWTAPELLRTVSCLDDVQMGTKKGDCYSYGIIISEILTRDVPFGHERNYLSIYSILDLIVDQGNPSLENERQTLASIGGDLACVRPKITNEQLPEGKAVRKRFRRMLDDVWCEEPQLRLSFQKVIPLLNKIHPSKGELMDNLIVLLESYSSNLEQVVDERTNDLEIEKLKVDNILSQMLPRQVVESLKNGEKVQPEVFDIVTVFYSDIVGFTSIAKKSEPMQVVDLLNTLYGQFDDILAQHDVYKLETIGDAYVVASGVPKRNGNLHAGEIAAASIDIVCNIMTVPIPHLPKDRLLLRIGIHSGSVVAGVVGLKMPRYTLFGETMQIASTLEATSKPLHVQVSHFTMEILKQLGGYSYKRRGVREVCGRKITTYWLVGKTGYGKVLPAIED